MILKYVCLNAFTNNQANDLLARQVNVAGRSVVLANSLVALAASAIAVVVLVGQERLRLLVDELVEKDGEECSAKGNGRVEIDCFPGIESLIEQRGKLDSSSDGRVHYSAVCGDSSKVSSEHSAGANIGSGQDEAVDGFLVGEMEFLICVGHEEENIDKGAKKLL